MNVVMTGAGGFVELQGTGEKGTFSTRRAERVPGAGHARAQARPGAAAAALGGEVAFLAPDAPAGQPGPGPRP